MVMQAKGKTLKRLGKNAPLQNDPSSAITFLNAYLKNGKKDAEAMALLGQAYMKVRDYEKAQHTFLNAYNYDKEKKGESLYYHAQMMKSNGQYDSAKINFQKFKKEYKGKDKLLKKQATREISLCDSVQQLFAIEKKIIIQHLDTSINKVNIEAAPINLSDDQLVFTSFRTEKREYEMEDDTAKSLKRKLYLATRNKGEWKFDGEFGGNLNNDEVHTGNASFSADRKRVYFTRCKLNYLDQMVCAIYVSKKEGDTWSEPVRLPKPINGSKYTSTMPAVTIDPVNGNDIIYFASNRSGGKGGLDIWYTVYNPKKDEYKIPKNAGSKINSSQDEMSPFFDSDTRTLYFSSNGLGGLGGYDVFKTRGDGKKFTGTENLGQPVNTGADEMYYTISTNREEGFFVSNRKGGNALKNKTCCDDIYYYKHSEYIHLFLKGTVRDALDPEQVIPNAEIALYIRDKKTKEKFLVKTISADSLGNYSTALEPAQDYFVVAKMEDYLGTNADVTTEGIVASVDLRRDLVMLKKPKLPIHIPNIKYEFDKSNILESSKIVLDTTVLRLLDANPELIVEIQSHTDSKGGDAYNMKLSQKRAESVVKYLQSKGISADRLRAKGYGETVPIAPNENPDGSDNPDNRARNRRTDFKIIGVIDAEIIIDAY